MPKTSHTGTMVLSRKDFLRGFGVLGLTAVGAGFGLTGGAWAQATTATSGGILRSNVSGDPPNFDPLSATSSNVMQIIGPCYNGLVRFDPLKPSEIIPDLATDWVISEDGLTFTFNLVQNAKFHDGRPMTSADVKFTFDTIRNPPEGVVSSRRKLLDNVQSIEAPGDHSVVFTLKRPSAAFLGSLANCWMMVMPKHILEVSGHMKEQVVGTGPFKFANHSRGNSYELVRNADYHVPDRPYLDGITVYVIPDGSTALSHLRSGQLDMQTGIQGRDVSNYADAGDIALERTTSTAFASLLFNASVAPFDNAKVRQALCLAIDRAAALTVTHAGEGALGGVTMPGKWALPDSELSTVPGYAKDGAADLERARQLLSEAGFANGLAFTVTVRKNPLFEAVGVFVKDQWAKIGVTGTLNIIENAAFTEARQKGDFAVIAGGGSYISEDPDAVFGDEALCGYGDADFCDVAFEDLFQAQSTEMDEAKRRELVARLELQVMPDYVMYPLYWRSGFVARSTRLMDYVLHPNIDQNSRHEDVWLAR